MLCKLCRCGREILLPIIAAGKPLPHVVRESSDRDYCFNYFMRTIVELFIRWSHLVAGMIWFSGIFFSAIIATPILTRNLSPVKSLQLISGIRDRLRTVVRITVHVLLTTGAMNIFIVGLNTKMEFSRNYIVIFVVKMTFVALMTLFHGLHISIFSRKLEATISNLNPDDSILLPPIIKLQKQVHLFAILTILSGLVVLVLSLSLR